ncbi:hypothetical protein HZS_6457 [Henneguya salminicola]|nr:hypothetical protein HZS_6457 [Henneguya salminicola]
MSSSPYKTVNQDIFFDQEILLLYPSIKTDHVSSQSLFVCKFFLNIFIIAILAHSTNLLP